MPRTDTIVIGGGQAGLSVSRCLREAGRDHVVLERGRLAESWRSQRWVSLRLLTPNWLVNLPGWSYRGDDPDGFMTAAHLVSVLERYADDSRAPVHEQTTVEAVHRDADGFTVRTDQGTWRSNQLVVATGHCMRPAIPAAAASLDRSILQLTADRYRHPAQLPDGGVLVVGASSTGTQLAEELAHAGRDVTLAVGNHTRMPRRYRGMDIFWWLDRAGMLDDLIDAHPAPANAVRSPSMQLVGSPERRNLDLTTCQAAGIRLTGHLAGFDGARARFASTLEASVRAADARMNRTLDRIDRGIDESGLNAEVDAPDRPAATVVGPAATDLDLRARGITTVLWATGYRREYPWLPRAAVDARGEIRHRHGVGALAGLYVVGLRFQRHRSSNFIGGVGRDAQFIVDHLTGTKVTRKELAA
jgi:putative flavoprotein involved in K+ transport